MIKSLMPSSKANTFKANVFSLFQIPLNPIEIPSIFSFFLTELPNLLCMCRNLECTTTLKEYRYHMLLKA